MKVAFITVTECQRLYGDTYILWFQSPELLRGATPGQFLMLRCVGLNKVLSNPDVLSNSEAQASGLAASPPASDASTNDQRSAIPSVHLEGIPPSVRPEENRRTNRPSELAEAAL